MLKIYFICPWEDSNSLLNKLKKNTPKNEGIWKNLRGVDSINDCDYIVILDDLHVVFLNMGLNNFMKIVDNINKIIYFQRENTSILNMCKKSWFRSDLLPLLKHNYSYEDDFFYTFTTAHFLNKTYDELKVMEYPKKTKKVSCVVSNKNLGSSYANRINFIKKYSEIYPNSIDIYGRGWSNNDFESNYKGELGSYHQTANKLTSKLDGLIPYEYSICLENYPDEKVTSEKITDSLLSWCMPIYSGSKYTNKYYPNKSFYLIDIKNEDVYSTVNNISKQSITQENIEAMRKARNLILDKYNIWQQIYEIIDNVNKYKLKYNYNLTIYFCHYPKSGGTYIKNLIYNVTNGVDNITENHINNSYIAKELKKKGIKILILPHDINYLNYKKSNTLLITTVRNPFTLLESYYSHGQLGFGNVLKDKSIKSFDDFLNKFINNNPYNRFEDNYLYKNIFFNNHIIFDIVFKLETIEEDFKNFMILCDLDINQVNFNLDNYNKNSYIFEGWVDKEERNHKLERYNGINISDNMKEKIYNKYKFYFDYFDYKMY